MTKADKLMDLLESIGNEQLVFIHNEYCQAVNNFDGEIYSMWEFDELMNGRDPSDIARMIFYGKGFNPNNDWFYFNGYGNLESTDYPKDEICIDDIVEHICRTGQCLFDDDIAEILEEYENAEED